MSRDEVHDRVAARYTSRFLRHYARSKISTDPLYAAVAERLNGSALPLLDIGCGIGLMELYLRESGYAGAIRGVDTDTWKIAEAQRAAVDYGGIEFCVADARDATVRRSNVLLLDLLHYLTTDEQNRLLASVAEEVPPGGVAFVRDAIRDGSWRYRVTRAQEAFSRAIRWSRVERLNFPTRERVVEPFLSRGFSIEVEPLWARTPFNNYLFVFRRSASGMTKE